MWPTGLYDLYAVIADFHDAAPAASRSTSSRARRRSCSPDPRRRARRDLHRRRSRRASATSSPRRCCPRTSSSARCRLGHSLAGAGPRDLRSSSTGLDLVTLPRELGATPAARARRSTTTALDAAQRLRSARSMGAVRGARLERAMGVAVIPRSAAEEPGPPIELRPIGAAAVHVAGRARLARAPALEPPGRRRLLALAIARGRRAAAPRGTVTCAAPPACRYRRPSPWHATGQISSSPTARGRPRRRPRRPRTSPPASAGSSSGCARTSPRRGRRSAPRSRRRCWRATSTRRPGSAWRRR